ncbi:hybrid sensor histidine kinase/response regulator [Pseudohongiella acticola]|jgi:signal transduction histidine kinase/CheY-like chemotaxis protein|uniref:hybrid sensor histidine kinase/response regulator n=1 Tax=Pseudohongiella acticola TaxID=1524254 RepID=UPI0030EBE43E
MKATQHIFRVRRTYNVWVGNETLEDYALRFTAIKARRWSIEHVAKTALGATAFLALEAIAAAVTLSYGTLNAIAAMVAVAFVILLTGFPIAYNAAKYGLDIDLLTRGAGFGYLGSTITSLIYASFTFIFFAIEGAILASALQALLGIPLWLGYIICAVAVIPIVTHGITIISKFQVGTQTFWLLLQCTALAVITWFEFARVSDWTVYVPATTDVTTGTNNGFSLALFGSSAAILFSLVAQIGEQVDYLRFMPEKKRDNRRRWWFWLLLAGPGWIVIGLVKMLLGSFLAYLAITAGDTPERAADPTYMYQMVFNYLTQSPTLSLVLAGLMVVVSQMKINVTNAYAGSIAWSNFFSRLTHSHPGRVVWLVFNVAIALLLMELGMYRALEAILGLFAIVTLSWLGSLSADLLINKPLGLSPSYVEFKRAHLYDINPVGTGSVIIASGVGILCYMGIFGDTPRHLAHFISLGICFVSVPALAVITRGRFYLARQSPQIDDLLQVQDVDNTLECCICESRFERDDIAYCPAYQGAICSLCCSLDSRCMDVCKPDGRLSNQLEQWLHPLLPAVVFTAVNRRVMRYAMMFTTANLFSAALLALVYYHMQPATTGEIALLQQSLWTLFFITLIILGVICWLHLLASESREVAQQESSRQTSRLLQEIEAHNLTDLELQKAKDLAERANDAKSRYLSGISHELRTPLQAILGYAQLLTQRADMPEKHRNGIQIIKRSGEHLAGLIEGLLDISKIEAGRLEIYRNRVKLPDLIDQMIQMFRTMALEKGIEFSCHIHNKLPDYVTTDEKRLRQILINLLSNAIKYTHAGSVEFHVQYRSEVAEFSVVDTGVGINEKDLHRILDPFERVRNIDVPNIPGTGLGLTIVRLLTEIMGGELDISSVPNEGSCFKVSLMLSRISEPIVETPPQRLISGYSGARKIIMVVDDDPIHRGLMGDLLHPLGLTTFEARDAHDCLDALKTVTPDIFLIDVSMPGIDGLALAEMLRKKGFQQPIIMISADAHERHRSTQTPSAHDDYLVKPINNQQLLESIGSLLSLDWIRNSDIAEVDPINTANDYHPGLAAIIDHAIVRELLTYADLGYKRGVNSKLEELASSGLLDEKALAYCQQLASAMQFSTLAKAFRAT